MPATSAAPSSNAFCTLSDLTWRAISVLPATSTATSSQCVLSPRFLSHMTWRAISGQPYPGPRGHTAARSRAEQEAAARHRDEAELPLLLAEARHEVAPAPVEASPQHLDGGSLRTNPLEPRWEHDFLSSTCSSLNAHTDVGGVGRIFNVGRVLVHNTPPASMVWNTDASIPSSEESH